VTGPVPACPPVLARHLDAWLGRWPAPGPGLEVVGCSARLRPGWDGRLHPVVAVLAGERGVLSVAPAHAAELRARIGADPQRWRGAVAAALGGGDQTLVEQAFRFTTAPAPLPDAGTWVAADHPALPPWMRTFGGAVLVAFDAGGRFLSGVGRKRHDRFGQELAVGTVPVARGTGLARQLVAQAARRVLAEGAVPTYAHALGNDASGRVADAAGLPDRGWRVLRLEDDRGG